MTQEEAMYQSLAACGAVLIAFIGVCHETIGLILFPWALTIGGPIAWHALGIFAIVAGLLVLGGTLRVIAFPVVPFALLALVLAVVVFIYTAVAHQQFHMFALVAAVSGGVTAIFHRKAAGHPGAPADSRSS